MIFYVFSNLSNSTIEQLIHTAFKGLITIVNTKFWEGNFFFPRFLSNCLLYTFSTAIDIAGPIIFLTTSLETKRINVRKTLSSPTGKQKIKK